MRRIRSQSEILRLSAKEWFDERISHPVHGKIFGEVALGIINLGRASECSSAAAQIVLRTDEHHSKFRLQINPDEFENFTEEQRAGVLWHELNHVVHKHIQKLDEDVMPNKRVRTLAQEIVCNDTVLHHGVDLPWLEPDEGRQLHYGKRHLGYNTFPKNTKEVYDLLVDSGMDGNPDDDQCSGIIVDGDGDITDQDILDAIGEVLDGMNELPGHADGHSDGSGDSSSDSDKKGNSGGTDGTAQRDDLVRVGDVSMDWMNLIRSMDPLLNRALKGGIEVANTTPDWRFMPPRYNSVRHSVRLPTRQPYDAPIGLGRGIKPVLVIAVDQSGSISKSIARKVVELATTIPRSVIDVQVCVFGTDFAPLDIDTGRIGGKHGSGTDFSAVDKFVKSLDMEYRQSNVIVFTDGGAKFMSGVPDNISKYWWVDIEPARGGFDQCIKDAVEDKDPLENKLWSIKDFAEGF